MPSENRPVAAFAVLGLSLGLSLIAAGWLVSDAVYGIRASQRYVTVKGFSEREVNADLAIWPLVFKVAGNDLGEIQKQMNEHRKTIRAFLEGAGFGSDEVSEAPPNITDFQAEVYRNEQRTFRYMAQTAITLRTNKVGGVKQAMEGSDELVSKGIVLVTNQYGQNAEFLFEALNDIKPEMIAEATRNAREAAEQFAKDSGSQVDAIRTARQGLFTIQNRDMNSPDRKKVRVVTTVEYFLVD